MTTTVTSPVGDTLDVYDDDELRTLFADGKAAQSLGLTFSFRPRSDSPRPYALLALWHEGAVVAPNASQELRDRAVRYGLDPHCDSSRVANALRQGIAPFFDVETRAKRTVSIRMTAVAERWLPILTREIESADTPTSAADSSGTEDATSAPVVPVPEPDAGVSLGGVASANGHGSSSAAAAVPVPEPRAPVEFELTNAVATALLTQVIEIVATGSGSGPALGRLQLDVEALEKRLGTQVAYVDTLRRQLREAGDEINALRHERDGLRQRLRGAEYNLSVATSADAQRIIDAEVRRQVDKIMRQAPAGAHSKMAAVS